MKNKILFRIIGAFSSSLIILSVFMQFSNLSSLNLWDMYNEANMMYMPIMIIAFGCIGVLFFSLNVKTEFAYATSGAMTFFTVMQLVQAYQNDTILSLGLGFYFVAIGGLLTGMMAFFCNLNRKKVTSIESSGEEIVNNFSNNNLQSNVNNYNMINSLNQNDQFLNSQQIQPQFETSQNTIEPISNINNIELNYQEAPQVIQNIQEPIPDINNMELNQQVDLQNIETQEMEKPIIDFEVRDTNKQLNDFRSESINNSPQSEINISEEPKTYNPVVEDFINHNTNLQSDNNMSESTNMQNLDIFGNFR